MSDYDWIKALKPGDKVVIDCGNWIRTEQHVATVSRTTKTQIIVNGRCDLFGKWRANDSYTDRYHKKNGQGIGKDADVINRLLKPCTPEIEAEFKEREKRKWLIANIRQLASMSAIQSLTTEQLETINGWLSK